MTEVLRRLAWRNAPFVLASAGLLGLFQFLIAAAVASVDVSGALQALLDTLPPFLQSVVATQLFGGLSTGSLLAFGWNHPIAHALGAAVAILLGANAVAGEIETGAMELVLGQPLSRARYLAAHVVFGALALAVTAGVGLLGTLLGLRAFALGPYPPAALARLGLGYGALQWAWFGIALALSSRGREGGRAAGAAFLLALVSYLAFVIGTVWKRAAFVLPYSLHHHFMPRAILVDGAGVGPAAMLLGAVGLAGVCAAWWWFRHRDLP